MLMMHRQDPSPSFLQYSLDASEDGKERSPKKPRLSNAPNPDATISSKLAQGTYESLDGLRKDAQRVGRRLTSAIRSRTKEEGTQRLSVEDLKLVQRIQAFEQVVNDVVSQESKYEAAHDVAVKQEGNALVNGNSRTTALESGAKAGTVLTLFGNAPTPKQLFSSAQQLSDGAGRGMLKTELPVEEMSLPNGLTATKVMPTTSDERKKPPAFEDSFAPPFNLSQLHPPKAQKRSTTRESSISWEFRDPNPRSSKKGGYTVQSLTVGDWLGYGGNDSKNDPSSPHEKRKQRDRALSGGESSAPARTKESLEEAAAKEEEALFRRAYSSFAPSCDNSRALVPEQTKSMVWWNKVGDRRYKETFAIDPALMDDYSALELGETETAKGLQHEEEEFSKVIEELDDSGPEPPSWDAKRDKNDVDQVLRDVSDLIEILASHQRIRNSTLAAAAAVSRTPMSPAPALSSRIGRPGTPAEDEVTTYHDLQRELAFLILKLPPYAVAKLNGDQLAELGVSRLITFNGKDIKGTMEEDQVARQAKHDAMATAAGIASLTRSGSSGSQHYSSTSQRTPAIGQAANTRYGSSASFTASRTPGQPSYQRSISSQSTYGTPSATAPRPGYGQPNQYSRPQPAYGQANTQQYYRNSSTPTNYGTYNSNQATPQHQHRPSLSSSQPLAQYQQQYQQRAALNAASYQSSQNRTASPIKPAGLQTVIAPQRPTQSTSTNQQPGSGRGTPVNYPHSQPPAPANGDRAGGSVVARQASGTPQPIAPYPPPPASQQPPQTNGHS